MVVLTNGKLNQSTVKAAPGAPEYKPVFVGKLGYDTQVNPDLRFRLTGSIYTTGESGGNYLYTGDRAGGRYYNVLAVETSDFRTGRSEEHTSELQSRGHLVCRLLLEKKHNRPVSPIL